MFLILFVLSLALVACSDSENAGNDNDENDPTENSTNDEEDDSSNNNNDSSSDNASGEPKDGGTVVGAMSTAPKGIFNPIFYTEAYENNILSLTHEGLVGQNENLEFIPSLAKSWETNEDQTSITFQLEEGVKWHDGEEFTAEDVIFTYKSMADPEYTSAGGVRTDYVSPLKGYEAYSEGKTDEFEGVTSDGDYTVTFHFQEPSVTPLKTTGFPIIPQHVFKDIAVEDMPSAPETLDAGKVIGTGPFQFTEMVEREQYILERHEDYWKAKPHLEKVVWQIAEQSVLTGLLETGEIDFVADPNGVPAADFKTVDGFDNVNTIEQVDFGYQLLGFKLHHRTDEDVQAGEINPDNWVENERVADQQVRQAIAHAVNRKGLIEGLLRGHGDVINVPIAQQFWAYTEEGVPQYQHNQDKAREMLDEAGYKDVNGDGFRENPDGEEWVLNLNYPTGNKIRERSAPIIAENLEEVGIKIDLRQPKEMSAYVEELMSKDNNDWDLYLIGWSLDSSDPDPSGLWKSEAAYNLSRWNNEESDQLIEDALKAPEAFEQDYRKEVYKEWQQLFAKDLPAVLLYAQNKIYAHNERLKNVDPLPYSFLNDTHEWWVEDAE